MRIEGSYDLPQERERIFALLVDEEVLRRCVPGCEKLVREGADRFAATLQAGLGPVSGRYEGTVTISEREPPGKLALAIEGTGKLGWLKGKGVLRLDEGGSGGTRVVYRGDVQVGGSIAGVGQRMIQGAALAMAGQFFAALQAEAKAAAEARPPPRQGLLRNLLRWIAASLRRWWR